MGLGIQIGDCENSWSLTDESHFEKSAPYPSGWFTNCSHGYRSTNSLSSFGIGTSLFSLGPATSTTCQGTQGVHSVHASGYSPVDLAVCYGFWSGPWPGSSLYGPLSRSPWSQAHWIWSKCRFWNFPVTGLYLLSEAVCKQYSLPWICREMYFLAFKDFKIALILSSSTSQLQSWSSPISSETWWETCLSVPLEILKQSCY